MTQFFLSLSIFSLLLFCLPFLNSLSFSKVFAFQIFNLNIKKNCIFLLCNGLLVFVAKISSSSPSSPENNSSSIDDSVKHYDYNYYDAPPQPKSVLEEKKAPFIGQNKNEDEENHVDEIQEIHNVSGLGEEDKFKNNEALLQDEATPFDDKFPLPYHHDDQEEEFDDDENGMLSTEELNKKFDEFIRKMKLEIRIEAQQQLALLQVN
ncbi:hypothetical protein M5689_014454 [Euphorbia peplus]|nr:hypothetical protein M5689_014454 [Euphorbia peplus]